MFVNCKKLCWVSPNEAWSMEFLRILFFLGWTVATATCLLRPVGQSAINDDRSTVAVSSKIPWWKRKVLFNAPEQVHLSWDGTNEDSFVFLFGINVFCCWWPRGKYFSLRALPFWCRIWNLLFAYHSNHQLWIIKLFKLLQIMLKSIFFY